MLRHQIHAIKSVTMIDKAQLVKDYAGDAANTGHSAVQVAILTARINLLSDHLKIHRKDNASTRGLLMMVSKRKSLLNYIKCGDVPAYKSLIERLGIRK